MTGFIMGATTLTAYACLYVGGQSDRAYTDWEETQWIMELEEERRKRMESGDDDA